jgi:hypothetical protein
MTAYTLKAWLKDKDSIHKQIQILSSHTFKDLHHALMRAFELGMIKAVCFYMCNAKWKKGQKIAFSNASKEKGVITMNEAVLGDYLKGGEGHIRYECKNGAEWLINIELVESKKPSASKRYPDWEDTSGVSLKQMNKRHPVVVVEEEFEEATPDAEDEEEAEGEESFGKDFGELEVPDDAGSDEERDMPED